jgi:hypothetical protein
MNEDAVRTLLRELGISLPADRAAAIAREVTALGPRLAATPRPAFGDEPTTFQVQSRTGAKARGA